MIDALLYAVRNTIWSSGLQYASESCDIMKDGQPPARAGNVFVAVHASATRTSPETDNKLEEYFGFQLTVTIRCKAPPDRIGNSEITVQLKDNLGMNRRVEALRALMHMNWGVVQDANNFLVQWAPDNQGIVYGFSEPARYKGCSEPRLEGDAWFSAKPGGKEPFGAVVEMDFVDARRFQAIAEYV